MGVLLSLRKPKRKLEGFKSCFRTNIKVAKLAIFESIGSARALLVDRSSPPNAGWL